MTAVFKQKKMLSVVNHVNHKIVTVRHKNMTYSIGSQATRIKCLILGVCGLQAIVKPKLSQFCYHDNCLFGPIVDHNVLVFVFLNEGRIGIE